jgi:uncharacterized membrane protein HdeD (DUF308 family)
MSALHARPRPQEWAEATRLWWLFLVAGIVWVLYGLFVLSLRPESIYSVAILAGVAFIGGGISQFILAQRVDSWRWLFYVGGVLGIIAGIGAFGWPGATLYVLAVFIAWYLVIGGIFTVVGAFLGPKVDWWWLNILTGLLMFVLGAWAVASPVRQILLFLNLVGIYALFYGFTEIFMAFALRAASKELAAEEAATVPTDAAPTAAAEAGHA